MRCAVVSIVIALAFAPQAFAVLRPLFPVNPEPPFSGEAIVHSPEIGVAWTEVGDPNNARGTLWYAGPDAITDAIGNVISLL
jgi:hypothetical protein